ncbi:MAG: FAD-dependent oxidoreductase [Candidatus Nomurabacteria bacterium]|jgi:thioredoxin reductase (NADPH)|nr:FAD-dependent oxidoreductase [Candidatus Nomurabacteria bacterium]
MIYDLIIIGAGPSALTAAIYAAREDMKVLVIEKGVVGGLMATIDNLENYPGFPNGIEGLKLAEDFQKQAERFGAEVKMFTTVEKISKTDEIFTIATDDGEFQAKTVLIATGSTYRKLNIAGEEMARYCATCDGAFYRDKKLVVIGGANSAIQEAIFLTKFATHVDILVRSHIKATKVLQEDLKEYIKNNKISVHERTTPDEIVVKDGQVIAVKAHDTDDAKQQSEFACDGVFIMAGVTPNTGFLDESGVELDATGHIKTDQKLMTNVKGIFASGDVRFGATKQVIAATGEGATAAMSIREFLSEK